MCIRDSIKTLDKAENEDLTFFDSLNYKKLAEKTKASCCITKESLKKYLPHTCEAIIVKSVLFELARITLRFYPLADLDYPDKSIKKPQKSKFPGVKFGNNVVIQDGAKIGLKGFGFIPLKEKNFRIPHIGKVVLEDNVEIGASCTIDRGSIGDTLIGKNTFLDNQVHMAHNVKIGENCMIAGQVGFAGSSTLGNNVSIGGQAGVSGHLKIGNNVKIGGGSGVVKDIPDDTTVMGYPAVPLKEFLKKN